MSDPRAGGMNGIARGADGMAADGADASAPGVGTSGDYPGGEDDEQMAHPAQDPSPARELSLHLLRMLETRMDAAGIALQGETRLVLARVQLKLFAAAAMFIAIWGGIVLLAIALPPDLRVPVLSAVVIAFVVLAVGAFLWARRKASTREVGSLHWFLDGLRQDLEVISRTLTRNPVNAGGGPNNRGSASNDFAA